MSKKVLITRIIPNLAYDLLTKAGFEVTVWEGNGPMTQEQLIERAKNVNALLSLGADKIDNYFFSQCSHLDIIAQFAV
jgi:lactate dehydrogenase-like 2-hydroxyacid dehydrogenase